MSTRIALLLLVPAAMILVTSGCGSGSSGKLDITVGPVGSEAHLEWQCPPKLPEGWEQKYPPGYQPHYYHPCGPLQRADGPPIGFTPDGIPIHRLGDVTVTAWYDDTSDAEGIYDEEQGLVLLPMTAFNIEGEGITVLEGSFQFDLGETIETLMNAQVSIQCAVPDDGGGAWMVTCAGPVGSVLAEFESQGLLGLKMKGLEVHRDLVEDSLAGKTTIRLGETDIEWKFDFSNAAELLDTYLRPDDHVPVTR